LPAQAVLVLAPHPDDEVFGCGGAVAGHVHAGVPVQVVILTDGAGGFGDAATRALESRAAAKVLGYGEPEFWGLPDRGLHYAEALVQRLLKAILSVGVDLVYAPSPWEVHPDHRQTALLASEAVQRAGAPVRLAFYEVGAPLRPNVLIDITAVLPAKETAMRCFASQLVQQDYVRKIGALNQYRTYTLAREVLAAEAYWVKSAQELAQAMRAGLAMTVSPGLVPDPAKLPNRQPLVSILIRSMDRNYLAEALDSVALQTYPSIEVVVVAVRPGHQPLPTRCGPFELRLVQTDTPLHRSQAANKALSLARGELLLFLDDDDWLMPAHVARLAEVLTRQPHALAAYTGISLVNTLGQPIGQVFDLPFDALKQLAGNLTPIHAVLFNSRVLASGCRFDESLDLYEDWDFWLQLAQLSPLVHLPGVSGVYRIHDSSGVHTEAGPMGAGSALVFHKWADRWTCQQFGQIMQRVWRYPELEYHLADVQQSLEEVKQQVATAESQLLQKQEEIQALTQSNQLLITQKAQAEELLTQRTRDIRPMLGSNSWRLNRPLRTLVTWHKGSIFYKLLRPIFRLRAILATEGAQGVLYRLQRRWSVRRVNFLEYTQWAQECDTPNLKTLNSLKKTIKSWKQTPLFSIVMPVYNPPLELLREAIGSVQAQVYPHWELCIADDASPDAGVWHLLQALANQDSRIKVVRRAVNGHISQASNSALDLAEGEFIALMDNDDLLPPDALYWIAEAVNRVPNAQIIYTDEDKLDSQGQRFGPYFKPDWNYTLFLGHNLISHLGVYRTHLIRGVGGFRLEFEGSQDYDLALRCIERVKPDDIVHVTRVLYHWRAIEGSTAMGNDAKPYAALAAQRALREHLQRIGRACEVEILPTSNYRCLRPGLAATDKLTVVLVGSGCATTGAPLPGWTTDPAFEVYEAVSCAAEGAAINATVAQAKGTLVALVRANLIPTLPGSLLELVRHALEAETGIAGGAVRDTHGRLISGGFVLSTKTVASVLLNGLPLGNAGYMGRGILAQELSAVAMDCVVMRKQVFDTSGGLDVDYGITQLGAVAFCLGLRKEKLKVIWCPDAAWTDATGIATPSEMHQHPTFLSQFGQQCARWLDRDPAYHPLLDAQRADFSLRVLS